MNKQAGFVLTKPSQYKKSVCVNKILVKFGRSPFFSSYNHSLMVWSKVSSSMNGVSMSRIMISPQKQHSPRKFSSKRIYSINNIIFVSQGKQKDKFNDLSFRHPNAILLCYPFAILGRKSCQDKIVATCQWPLARAGIFWNTFQRVILTKWSAFLVPRHVFVAA